MCYIRQAKRSLYKISDNIMTQGFGNTAEWALSKLHSEIESTETTDIIKMGLYQYLDQF